MDRKITLLIAVFFVLAACNEDVYQEIDQQNEILEQSNTASDDGSGDVKPFTSITGGYQSPWEFGSTVRVDYYHHTLLANYGIWVRVTPYIGLAYYDGADDGTYNTPGGGSFNLAGGGYPNLYNGGQEYGNYIQANPIVLHGLYSTHEVYIESTIGEHCPVTPTVLHWVYNVHDIFFDMSSTAFPGGNATIQPHDQSGYVIPPNNLGTVVPPPPSATALEEQLLAAYGKVMYYKVEFGTNYNAYTQTRYAVMLPVDDVNTLDWTSMGVSDFLGGDLYYSTTSSSEIVIDAQALYVSSPPNTVMEEGIPMSIPGYNFRTVETTYDPPGSNWRVWIDIY